MLPRSLTALALAGALAGALAVAGCGSARHPADGASAPDPELAACTSCHGDAANGNAAPPRSVRGFSDPAQLAVGAHQAHLRGGAARSPIACSECHVVPASPGEPGHGTSDVAAVTFGQLATSGGTAASWDRTHATCATYCHGATLAGGQAAKPLWTRVDGSQAACDSCHGLPPPPSSGHPVVRADPAACAACHPATVLTDGRIDVAGGKHIDGHVDLGATGCTSCHGDAATQSPAPPRGAKGETSTAERAVGAHQRHLSGGAVRGPVGCTECHVLPTDLSHVNGQVDLRWGPLATSGGAAPVWNGASCASTYCHGGTLAAGGSNTQPKWTQVDGTQAACGTCHGVPPPTTTGHPSVTGGLTACAQCHPATVKADGTIDVAGGKHMNGVLDVATLSCTTCHGDATRATNPAAPPKGTKGETATTAIAVGAHQTHLGGSALRAAIACTECHVVPTSTSHENGTPTVTFGTLAKTGGASPAWDRATATCASTYCHGATLSAGGTITKPTWTRVDGSQDACGTCHGAPPPTSTGHPAVSSALTGCASCHPATMKADGTIDVAGGKHIDGQIEVSGGSCNSCHGGATNDAPPKGTKGETATTTLAVGAHQQHLTNSAIRQAVACTECHRVPASTSGHPTGVVDLTFGPLATTAGAVPRFDAASATCASTYCHGATLAAGGTITTPIWTRVDGTQAACGTCHGIPPPTTSGHPSVTGGLTACAQCHPATMKSDGTVDVAGGKHMNGVLDVASLSCTSCHGDGARATNPAAPPKGTKGETATTARAVGAHQSHLTASATRAAVACTECHVVPTSTTHSNGTPTVTFGTLARTGGATPTWNGTTCSNVYCHGGTIANGGATITAPTWTKVDGTQAACGSCHGLPPPAAQGHPAVTGGLTACASCHTGTMNANGTINVAGGLHMNGAVDASSLSCTSCHGDGTRASNPAAPPKGTKGETATTARAVGAHQTHLNTGAVALAIACTECHVVPTSTAHSNGTPTVTFGALAKTGGASPTWSGTTCSNVYCHGGNLANGGGTITAPTWTKVDGAQNACGSCHGLPPPAAQGHPVVTGGLTACASCHPGTMNASGTLNVAGGKHVNGIVEVSGGSCTSCHGDATRATNPAAPPTGTKGETATTARAVGAHQTHLNTGTMRGAINCSECHVVPTSTSHSNGTATVTFGALANTGTASSWNGATCATYCHGATLGGGTLKTPTWTKVDGTQAACGTCHGLAPSTGQHGRSNHVSAGCGACHSGYSKTSINAALHVNGVKNVGGSGTKINTWNATSRSCAPSCHGSESW